MTRVAVITGAGTGIGRAVAERLVANGDRVVLTGRRQEVLDDAVAGLAAKGVDGAARAVSFDTSDPIALRAVLEELPERVDVLVNAAGGNTDLISGGTENNTLEALRDSWLANF